MIITGILVEDNYSPMQSESRTIHLPQVITIISHENDIMMEEINSTALEELNFDHLRNMMEGINNNTVLEEINVDELLDENLGITISTPW